MFKKFIFWNYKETPEYIEAEDLEAEIVDKCFDKLTRDLVFYSLLLVVICLLIYNGFSILVNNFQTHFADSQIPGLKLLISLSFWLGVFFKILFPVLIINFINEQVRIFFIRRFIKECKGVIEDYRVFPEPPIKNNSH